MDLGQTKKGVDPYRSMVCLPRPCAHLSVYFPRWLLRLYDSGEDRNEVGSFPPMLSSVVTTAKGYHGKTLLG